MESKNIKSTRCSWSSDETKHLITLMKEHKVMDLLDGKTRRNNNVYLLLANELSKKGFNKSGDQVKLKFRTLKTEFMKTKRGNSKSGAGRKTMAHFNELEDLLGDRPVAAAVGLDTTITEEFLEMCCDDFEESGQLPEEGVLCESVAPEPQQEIMEAEPQPSVSKAPKKKRSVIQTTLLEIASDLKESQESALEMIRNENEKFLAEQRRLHEDYLRETREIMAEDRQETREMLLEILKQDN